MKKLICSIAFVMLFGASANAADIKVIPDGAFQNCTGAEFISLPLKDVESIGDDAFNGCTSLKIVNVPASTKTIGARAFKDCTNIKRVVIKGMDTEISEDAFDGCTDSGFEVFCLEGSKAADYVRNTLGKEPFIITGNEIYGDMNGDGEVGTADISVVVDEQFKHDPNFNIKAHSVYTDGSFGTNTISAIVNELFKSSLYFDMEK